jgi:probable HAF family extracellular repeat protein
MKAGLIRLKNEMGVSVLFSVILSLTAGLIAPGQAFAQTAAYKVFALPKEVDGGQVGCALNNLGDIAGRAGNSVPNETRATIWGHDKFKAQKISFFSADEYSSASGINDLGEIAGAGNTNTSIVPFFWSPTGGIRRLPTLPDDNGGQALGVNKFGDVVGYSSGPSGSRAFIWSWKKGTKALKVSPDSSSSEARHVNDAGEVAGTSRTPKGDRAILWSKNGDPLDLGTLPGDTSSEANSLNNAGDVVGFSRGPGKVRAFLWTKAAGMQNLGVLPGGSSSRAVDINDGGSVVGTSDNGVGDRAFIWTLGAGIKDLNDAASTDLHVAFVGATAINKKGLILVMGKDLHDSDANGGTPGGVDDCAPAPPSTFVLIPAK